MGYIIESERGTFLASSKTFWFGHNSVEEAFVHPDGILTYLRSNAINWKIKPAKAYPATYQGGKTTITGPSIPFRV
jgi:hypothetical protein